ncbi:MAG: 6-phospho-3-hexuloisomerase [Longicatena sp.]
MNTSESIVGIGQELATYATHIKEEELDTAISMLSKAKRIFVGGSGRSGFVARAFANRMMHLGITMYVVGETTTPSIRKDDVLFIISGSGNTASHVNNAFLANKEGAKVITITIFPQNKIGSVADACVVLPGKTDKIEDENQSESLQPAGNMFEQLSWLTCDAIAMSIQKERHQTQEQMHYRHANME